MADSNDALIGELLARWKSGDLRARDQVVELMLPELKAIAHRHMLRQGKNHTLQTTALVNEAMIRFLEDRKIVFHDRLHLLRLSARVMRQLLCDHARSKDRRSRKPDGIRIEFDDPEAPEKTLSIDPVDLESALERLDQKDTQLASLVDLRYFHQLTMDECAELLKIPKSTLEKRWQTAKALLARELGR